MIVRLGMILSLVLTTWACSGDDEQKPKEPVAAEQDTNKVPDNPGSPGETAAKPAGEGQANADAAAATPPPAAEPEKSTPPTEAVATPAGAGGEMVVKAGALNVRKGPGTKHAVVRTLKKGEKVAPQSCEKNWCKLAENEYVSKKYLKEAK